AVGAGALSAIGCSSSEQQHVYRDERVEPVAYETRQTRVVDQPRTYETRTVREPVRVQTRTVREPGVYRTGTYDPFLSLDPHYDYYPDLRWDDDGDGWDDVEIHHGNREVEILLEEKFDD